MKFSTGWFSKLLHFRRGKADETAAAGEGAQREADTIEPPAEPAKPGLRERLLGMFKRGKAEQTDDEPGQPAEEPQTEVLPETQPGPMAGSEEAVDVGAGIGTEMSKPGLWTRLIGMFRWRPKIGEAGAQADATELFSWGEGEGQPQRVVQAAEKVAQAAGKDSDKRKQAEGSEFPEEGEELPAPGLGARVAKLLKKKIVLLALLLGIIMIGMATGGLLLYQQRQHEKARIEALEKKNKQLESENKKLQAVKQKPVAVPRKVPAKTAEREASPNAGDASDQGPGKPAGSSDDCTVNNKASAAEVLKRCIENFNAADRR